MPQEILAASPSKKMVVAGWIMGALPALMLLFSAVMKFNMPPDAAEQTKKMGWDLDLIVPLGIVELVCAILYLIPRTAVLGAILVTGYLGGAIATHVRVHEQFAIPAVLGVLVWGGLWLRDARIRSLLPIRST